MYHTPLTARLFLSCQTKCTILITKSTAQNQLGALASGCCDSLKPEQVSRVGHAQELQAIHRMHLGIDCFVRPRHMLRRPQRQAKVLHQQRHVLRRPRGGKKGVGMGIKIIFISFQKPAAGTQQTEDPGVQDGRMLRAFQTEAAATASSRPKKKKKKKIN